ncbi:MAG: SGNH/GDSL hydrolase family protein [Acidimicrobiales bacterium]|nr:SGNH/GDSL hydrolase family protein [Acidimicrobiales bacterium]MCB9373296.1 SGNH/GDSL hydrolase family protein [Microthrixaceae bacterium]
MAAALVVGTLGLLVVEVLLARRGPDLEDREPLDLDGLVGAGRAGATEPVVWLGDSTAAGVGASSAEGSLPRQVAAAADHPVRLTVLAESGARVGDVLDDQVGAVPAGTDTVYVSVGANDAVHLTRSGDFRRRYQAVLDALPPDARVVLLGVPDLGSPPRLAQPLRFLAGVRGGTLDAVIHDLASAGGHPYVDIAGETGPAFRRDPGRLFAADDYHPSDAGYRRWADAVVAAADEGDR